MNIRTPRELKNFAGERLSHVRDVKRIVMIYSALTLGLTGLVTVLSYVLGLQIGQLGGLSNLRTRNILSSVQSMLPIAQSFVSMCLNVGFLAAMLRIARGQYVSPNTLRLGFDRFWVLLRCSLIKGLLYSAVLSLGVYLGIMLFMLSPLSDGVVELLMPYLSETSVLNAAVTLDDAAYVQFAEMMVPAYVICGLVVCILAVPMLYSYRMVSYIIIDRPALGAMAALRESKRMMRGSRIRLFKLDLSMWWYYVVMTLAVAVGYGDMILPMLGVSLPWSEDVSYFLFYGLYLAAAFGIYYLLLDRVEVTYALFYDSIKPEEKQDNSVVLGNIFQM